VSADLRRRLDRLAAPGADPDRLAGVLAWSIDPSRSLASLRRAVADRDGAGPDLLGTGRELPARAQGVAPLDVVLRPPERHLVAAVTAVVRAWLDLGVRAATIADPVYPDRLRAGWPTVDAPPLLAWRGAAPEPTPAVAIVGARRATGYGTGVAAWLADSAAAAGARVVSGGARGIDAAAHLAALEGPGGTTVVLGCGHAVRYPRPHAGPGGLFDRVVDHGGTIVSELLPHAPASPHHVRARNRIVAGLADVVVVVEGGTRSGALLTATAAADRDIPVLAVPGDVRAPGSAAPHRLLAEGAGPCTGPPDVLEALGTAPAPDGRPVAAPTVLPDDVRTVLAAAWPRPVPVDDLAARTGRAAPALLGALTRARVAGETTDDARGVRLRRAPS
jgi:DNA processing protein